MNQLNSLIVCPTSHMDWNWKSTFEEYYKSARSDGTPEENVQRILDAAFALFANSSSFQFNLAEAGWLARYLADHGGQLPPNNESLALLGGALTSPDNLVCNGEVFVRTYLLGRQWARSVGLGPA